MQEAGGFGIPVSGISPLTPPPASRLVLLPEDKATKILLDKQDPPYPSLNPRDGIPLNIPGGYRAWATTHWHCWTSAPWDHQDFAEALTAGHNQLQMHFKVFIALPPHSLSPGQLATTATSKPPMALPSSTYFHTMHFQSPFFISLGITQSPNAGKAHRGGVHPCRLRLKLTVFRILTINKNPTPPLQTGSSPGSHSLYMGEAWG